MVTRGSPSPERVFSALRDIFGKRGWINASISFRSDEVSISRVLGIIQRLAEEEGFDVGWQYYKSSREPSDREPISVVVSYKSECGGPAFILDVLMPLTAFELCESLFGPPVEVDADELDRKLRDILEDPDL